MSIPKTKAAFKRLPYGTKLILIDNQVHTGLGKRTVLGLVDRGKTMTLKNEQCQTMFLPLTGEYFQHGQTFGFLENGQVAAEYTFDTEGMVYSLEPGRNIYKDGKPFVYIGKCPEACPAEADEIAHKIVDLLNKAEG